MREWWNKRLIPPGTQPGTSRVPSLLSPASVEVRSEGAGPRPSSSPPATRGTETPERRRLQRDKVLPRHTAPGTWLPGCCPLSPSPLQPLGTTAGVGRGRGRGVTNTRAGDWILGAVPCCREGGGGNQNCPALEPRAVRPGASQVNSLGQFTPLGPDLRPSGVGVTKSIQVSALESEVPPDRATGIPSRSPGRLARCKTGLSTPMSTRSPK